MPMVLVHPREADMATWAYAKNAYPGIAWEIPIVVQGGAWPFRYEIVDDGGAAGLTIGGELSRTQEDGFVVHRPTDEYGVLSWADPVAGTYALTLRVTDQEGATLEFPLSLTVGTEGWLFVDADAGNDATGDGTIDAPFASLMGVHGGANDGRFAGHRVFLSGVVPLDGNVSANGALRFDPEMVPAVLVGRPGGGAVLESSRGKLAVFAPDFYLGNLEYRHRADYVRDEGDPVHLFVVGSSAARFTIHDVAFTRMQGVPVNTGLGNSSVIMFTRGSDRPYVAVVHCDISGPSGVFTSTYSLRHAVFELNRWHDADLALGDGSVPSIVYVKGDNESVTIRANDMFENNRWSGLSGIGINEARLIEISHNRVRTPYDSGRAGSIRLFTNSPASGFAWTSETPVWVDRNSLRQRIVWEGDALAAMPDGTVRIERNVVDPAAIPTSSRITSTNNAVSGGLLDDRLELAPPTRADHFGQRGATIAVPID